MSAELRDELLHELWAANQAEKVEKEVSDSQQDKASYWERQKQLAREVKRA